MTRSRRIALLAVLLALAVPATASAGRRAQKPGSDRAEAQWNAGWAREKATRARTAATRANARLRTLGRATHKARRRATLARARARSEKQVLDATTAQPIANDRRAAAWARVDTARKRVDRENTLVGRARALLSRFLPFRSERAAAIADLEAAEVSWGETLGDIVDQYTVEQRRTRPWAIAERQAMKAEGTYRDVRSQAQGARGEASAAAQHAEAAERAAVEAERTLSRVTSSPSN